MPIPVAEARKFRVATLSQKKFESPDFMIKPRIIGFLAKNKEKAFSSDELYQALVPAPSRPDPESVGLPTDSKVRETYQLRSRFPRPSRWQLYRLYQLTLAV